MTTTDDIATQAQSWFIQLSDVDAPVSSWLAFQDWLEQDEAHRLAYDAVEQLWVELDDAVSPAIIARLAANDAEPDPRERQASQRRVSTPSRRTWIVSAMAIAASLVVAVGVWPRIGAALGTETYSSEDRPRTVELSDGSHIYLNRHSVVSVRMQASGRAVTLADGEAAFDVTHDPSRPFVVTAGDRAVTVLGTAFNVVNHAGRFSVGVSRGHVAVKPSRATTVVHLLAGQRIDQIGGAQPVLSRTDPQMTSSWRQGVLVYRDAPLAVVANELSRYFDKPVTVDASAQPLHFTGALRVGDEATMLEQLQAFVPVRATRSSSDVRLTARGAD